MKLRLSVYGLTEALKRGFELIEGKIEAPEMTEIHSAPCVFQSSRTIAVCCVDDLIVLT